MQGKGYGISRMLLYARTTSEIQPDSDYVMSGNKMGVKTSDLNYDFEVIKKQLDGIANGYFG